MTTDRDETDLDEIRSETEASRPELSGAVMARILADTEAVRRERENPVRPPLARVRRGGLEQLADALGGWPALGTLAASVVLGLGLDLMKPAGISGLADSVWGEPISVAAGLDEPHTQLNG